MFTLDCPPDAPLTPCAHCRALVESVDGLGRCDDCACDPLLVALDEVALVDVNVAVQLGRLSFTARTAPGAYLTPCALCAEPTAPDELDHVDGVGGADVPVCLGCLGSLDAWHCDRYAADLDAAMEPSPLPWERAWTPDLAIVANDQLDTGEAA